MLTAAVYVIKYANCYIVIYIQLPIFFVNFTLQEIGQSYDWHSVGGMHLWDYG